MATLPELRQLIPALDHAGSTESQYLHGRTPLIERIGPSIYGIRGFTHDTERLSREIARAAIERHPWIERGGWAEDSSETFRYRLPSRYVPSWIRLPRNVVSSFSVTAGPTGIVEVRTDSGPQSLPIRIGVGGAGLGRARSLFESIGAGPGDEVDFAVGSDGVWQVSKWTETSAADDARVSIRLGRGWVSVGF